MESPTLKSTVKIACILCLLGSCVDTIELDINGKSAGRIVIEGFAKKVGDMYLFKATVSQTSNLNGDIVNALVDNVKIELMADGMSVFQLVNSVESTVVVEDFHASFGGSQEESTFAIRAELQDGSIFISDANRILSTPLGASLGVSYEERTILNDVDDTEEAGFVKLQANTSLKNLRGERVSFRWDVSGVYRYPEVVWTTDPFFRPKTCYVDDFSPVNTIQVLNSNDFEGDLVEGFEIEEKPADYKFSSGYYFTVLQHTLTSDAALYWQEIAQSVQREGTVFDPPTGSVRTNIEQVSGETRSVLGYFYTSSLDTLRYKVTREEAGAPIHQCALQQVSEACCDCIKLANSTYNKPIYWE